MATFLGKSTHALDDKFRLILPKRFVDELAPKDREFTLTAGFEGCLLLLDAKGWEHVSEKVSDAILGDRRSRAMRRLFLGHAERVTPDRQNRMTIGESLREYAGIDEKGEVVLVGAGRSIEIWAKARWQSALEEAASTYGDSFSDNDLIGSTAAPSLP